MFGVDNNMRIELTLDSADNEKVRLPRINLNILQAMIYKIMPDELSEFLHEKGIVSAIESYSKLIYL